MPTRTQLGPDCLKKPQESDLVKVEETLTWLKGRDDRTYVRIQSTVYTRR